MSLTDPIGDMLTSMRNGSRVGKPLVEVPASRLKSAILDCMKREGFIQNWRLLEGTGAQGTLRIYLRYTKDRRPLLREIRRVSKPGLRVYRSKDRLTRVWSGLGVAILTTPKGVITDGQAREENLGGEVICYVR